MANGSNVFDANAPEIHNSSLAPSPVKSGEGVWWTAA